MLADPDKLLHYIFPQVTQTYTAQDCMLYALGVGMGSDPTHLQQLRFVYEDNLLVMPSQSVMLAHPGFWAKEPALGLDWVQLLQVGQEIIMHKPLPPTATVTATTRFTEVSDKGARLGAYIVTERTVRDVITGDDYCTIITAILARGDGGFGGERKSLVKTDLIPSRAADFVCDLATLPQQALLYRLSGDFNPLHASPEIAQAAGFRVPILHGLCTLGVLTHALLKTCCDYDPARFKHMRLHFSAPVYPGETIRTEIWREDNQLAFRCKSVEQDKLVINNGYLLLE
ncbi:MAG: MaoC family dehydratase [Gammaproteobacteria bacterium]|nr:MaoC family dehydratase [Gammaproteobacteria bacterium]